MEGRSLYLNFDWVVQPKNKKIEVGMNVQPKFNRVQPTTSWHRIRAFFHMASFSNFFFLAQNDVAILDLKMNIDDSMLFHV